MKGEKMVKAKPKVIYHCARCNRRLRNQRWVYSTHTGQRFCWPGEGCHR